MSAELRPWLRDHLLQHAQRNALKLSGCDTKRRKVQIIRFRTFEVKDDPTGPPGGLWAEVSDGSQWIVVHFPADNVQEMHQQERKTLPGMVGGIVQVVPEAYVLERVPSRSGKLESRPSLALRMRMVTLVGAIGEDPHGRPTPVEGAEPAFKTWTKAVLGDELATSTYAREVDRAIQANKTAQERQLAAKRSSSTRPVAGLDPLRDTSVQMALQRSASASSNGTNRRKRKRPGPKSKTEVQPPPRGAAESEEEDEASAMPVKTAKQIKKETRKSFIPRNLADDHWYTIPRDQIEALKSISYGAPPPPAIYPTLSSLPSLPPEHIKRARPTPPKLSPRPHFDALDLDSLQLPEDTVVLNSPNPSPSPRRRRNEGIQFPLSSPTSLPTNTATSAATSRAASVNSDDDGKTDAGTAMPWSSSPRRGTVEPGLELDGEEEEGDEQEQGHDDGALGPLADDAVPHSSPPRPTLPLEFVTPIARNKAVILVPNSDSTRPSQSQSQSQHLSQSQEPTEGAPKEQYSQVSIRSAESWHSQILVSSSQYPIIPDTPAQVDPPSTAPQPTDVSPIHASQHIMSHSHVSSSAPPEADNAFLHETQLTVEQEQSLETEATAGSSRRDLSSGQGSRSTVIETQATDGSESRDVDIDVDGGEVGEPRVRDGIAYLAEDESDHEHVLGDEEARADADAEGDEEAEVAKAVDPLSSPARQPDHQQPQEESLTQSTSTQLQQPSRVSVAGDFVSMSIDEDDGGLFRRSSEATAVVEGTEEDHNQPLVAIDDTEEGIPSEDDTEALRQLHQQQQVQGVAVRSRSQSISHSEAESQSAVSEASAEDDAVGREPSVELGEPSYIAATQPVLDADDVVTKRFLDAHLEHDDAGSKQSRSPQNVLTRTSSAASATSRASSKAAPSVHSAVGPVAGQKRKRVSGPDSPSTANMVEAKRARLDNGVPQSPPTHPRPQPAAPDRQSASAMFAAVTLHSPVKRQTQTKPSLPSTDGRRARQVMPPPSAFQPPDLPPAQLSAKGKGKQCADPVSDPLVAKPELFATPLPLSNRARSSIGSRLSTGSRIQDDGVLRWPEPAWPDDNPMLTNRYTIHDWAGMMRRLTLSRQQAGQAAKFGGGDVDHVVDGRRGL